jgi:hypothetical protein
MEASIETAVLCPSCGRHMAAVGRQKSPPRVECLNALCAEYEKVFTYQPLTVDLKQAE